LFVPMTDDHRTLGELAKRFGLTCRGDDGQVISGVGTLATARAGQIAFLANPVYRKQLMNTQAAAVVLRESDALHCPTTCLIAADPYVAFAKIAALFEPRPKRVPGAHASAVVAVDARVDASACIGPHVSIGARSIVEAGVLIGPCCVIGEDCIVGQGSELVANVTLVTRVRLGRNVRIHPGAVIGADGFGLAMDSGRWIKVPQLGGVRIGDDCEIGANTCIDRGAIEDTVLEEDVRLDNQVQIGHNVVIGAHTAMAGCVAVAGSTRFGRYCLIGGGAGFVGHIEIADKVMVTAMSLVTHSLTEAGEYSSGTPIQPNRDWRRNAARFKHLDELARKMKTSTPDKDQG
jgi:UDP-3-O-[3-hydroxymyristoyl] glucosamine N-acyltransferase